MTTPEDTKLKLALKKDFNQLLVKEFTTDWKAQRFVMGLQIDVMSLDNLNNLITLHTQKEYQHGYDDCLFNIPSKYEIISSPTPQKGVNRL